HPFMRILIGSETARRMQESEREADRETGRHEIHISLASGEWKRLEEIASGLAAANFRPSTTEVAGALLSLSLRGLQEESTKTASVTATEATALLRKEIAARSGNVTRE